MKGESLRRNQKEVRATEEESEWRRKVNEGEEGAFCGTGVSEWRMKKTRTQVDDCVRQRTTGWQSYPDRL